jgi:hypothetical protein
MKHKLHTMWGGNYNYIILYRYMRNARERFVNNLAGFSCLFTKISDNFPKNIVIDNDVSKPEWIG